MAERLGAVQRTLGTEGSSLVSGMASQGVQIMDAGKMRPLIDLLGDFSDKLKLITSEEERSQVGTAILGRRLDWLAPILLNTKINFRDYIAELEKNVPLSAAVVSAQADHARELNKLGHEWEEAKLKMGGYWSDFETRVLRGVALTVNGAAATAGALFSDQQAPGAIPFTRGFGFAGQPGRSGTSTGDSGGMAAIAARENFKAQMEAVISGNQEDLVLRQKINTAKKEYESISNSGTEAEIRRAAENVARLNESLKASQEQRKEAELYNKQMEDGIYKVKFFGDVAAGAAKVANTEFEHLAGTLDRIAGIGGGIDKLQNKALDAAGLPGSMLGQYRGETTAEIMGAMAKPPSDKDLSASFFGPGTPKDTRAFDYWKSAASSMFDALTAGGQNMWSNIANWGKATILTIMKDIFSNAIGSLFGGGGGGLGSVLSGAFGGIGGIGRGGGANLQGSLSSGGAASSLSAYSGLISAGGMMAGSAMMGSAYNSGSVGMGVAGGIAAGAGTGLSIGMMYGAAGGPIGAGIGAAAGAIAGTIIALAGRGAAEKAKESARRADMQSIGFSDIVTATTPESSLERDLTGRMSDWVSKAGGNTIIIKAWDAGDIQRNIGTISQQISRGIQSGAAGSLIDTLDYAPA
jgi:hypothetical protein